MAGWREDIQGKQRIDSLDKDRDVFVNTKYGKVQGFKVYLYDRPDPNSLYRPNSEAIERVQGVTYSFLGIPYALPPIEEGRFKVFFNNYYLFLLFNIIFLILATENA